MKQCTKCSQAIPDNAKYCSACGQTTNPAPGQQPNIYGTVTYEQEALRKLDNGLKWEAICYRVVGIATIVLVVLSLLLGTAVGVLSYAVADGATDYISENYRYEDYYIDEYGNEYHIDEFVDGATDAADVAIGVASVLFWVVMIFSSLVSIAYAVVNLVAAGRVTKHRKALYTDCTGACDHAKSVGVIIFAVFFNLFALIPIIINNVHVADNKTTFALIRQNQTMGNTQNV